MLIGIEGRQLDHFATVVQSALAGNLGAITRVEVEVTNNDTGLLIFVVNGHRSEPIGFYAGVRERGSALRHPQTAVNDFNPDANHEGSGNPYANVQDEDPANVLPRLDRLERFANIVSREHSLGFEDIPLQQF